jgi:hypothetical protein
MRRFRLGRPDAPATHEALVTSRIRRDRPGPWGLLAVIGVALLCVLGGLAGRPTEGGTALGLPSGLWKTLQSPLVLAALAAATLISISYALRRSLLWR